VNGVERGAASDRLAGGERVDVEVGLECTHERFDLILAMDKSNRAGLLGLARTPAQRGKIRMLREFDPQRDDLEVPDPWYGGQSDFEQTYQIIERSVRGLLEALERGEV